MQPLRFTLSIFMTLALGTIVPFVLFQPAQAMPLTYVAATTSASGCALLDGTTGTLAPDGHTCCPTGTENDGTACIYAKYIDPLIQLFSAAVGIVVVIAIIYGAIEHITSEGDPQRAAAGTKRIINALIGLAAFLLLYAFLQFIIPGGLFNNG